MTIINSKRLTTKGAQSGLLTLLSTSLVLSTSCKTTEVQAPEPAASEERWSSRTEMIAAPPGSANELAELQERSPDTLSAVERRELERQRREARDRRRLSTAVGPAIPLQGQVVSRATGEPEVDCDISVGGADALSDAEGRFSLDRVPSGGLVRVRFNCRGLIERQTIEVPANVASYELPTPIALGPSAGRSALADESSAEQADPASSAPGSTLRDALADLAATRESNEGGGTDAEEDERVSLLGNAANAIAHIAGTAAAVSPPEGGGERYELLGHLDRAEATYEARSAGEEYIAADGEGQTRTRQHEPEFANTPYVRDSTAEANDAVAAEDSVPDDGDENEAAAPSRPDPTPSAGNDAPAPISSGDARGGENAAHAGQAPATPPTHSESIDGTLSTDEVHGELRRRAHALRNCYSAPLEADWDYHGSVEVSWRITPEGSVSEVTLVHSSFDDEALDGCFLRRISRLDFAESDGPTEVRIRFVYNIWGDPVEPFAE